MELFVKQHPDVELRQVLAAWYRAHPDGTPGDALQELNLWDNTDDRDAWWLVWRCLPEDAQLKIGPVR